MEKLLRLLSFRAISFSILVCIPCPLVTIIALMRMYFHEGTSNLVFPTSTANAIYALISPNIKPFGSEGAYGIACSQIGSITATLDFTFKTAAGAAFNLTIPPEELNVGPFASQPTMCQTLINAQDGYDILGGSVLKHYYSV